MTTYGDPEERSDATSVPTGSPAGTGNPASWAPPSPGGTRGSPSAPPAGQGSPSSPVASADPTTPPGPAYAEPGPYAEAAPGAPPDTPSPWYAPPTGPTASPYGGPSESATSPYGTVGTGPSGPLGTPPWAGPAPAPAGGGPGSGADASVWVIVAVVAALISALVGGAVGAVVAHSSKKTTVIKQTFTANTPIGKTADIHEILAKVQPAVVSIHTTTANGAGAGTGMILTPDGEVLTNFHVIAGATTIRVNLFTQTAPLNATVLGADQVNDVALIKLAGVQGLPTVQLGDSSKLQVGDDLVAIGNALNLPGGPTVTEGIVSATDRNLSVDDPTAPNLPLIQTDAAINPGNSGGPLVNSQAQVVGMNTLVIQQASAQEAAQNLGFAIAVNTIKPLLPDLAKGITHVPAFLGVSVATLTPDIVSRYGLSVSKGAIVAEVAFDGPAAQAGLQPLDVITNFDGQAIDTADQIVNQTQKHKPGDSVPLTYVRGSASHTISVTLGSKPSTGG